MNIDVDLVLVLRYYYAWLHSGGRKLHTKFLNFFNKFFLETKTSSFCINQVETSIQPTILKTWSIYITNNKTTVNIDAFLG